ncbi:MAG: Maf family protein, partial [Rhodospirillaceae bacterium]|nr:Maf family protein [Rhodospirillaceae bacterium]
MIPMVLASASAVRARLLESAGVTVTVDPAGIGEEDVKASLKADGASASLIADALADLKARQVSMRHPGALVIGADQVLECDGRLFDKPVDLTGA